MSGQNRGRSRKKIMNRSRLISLAATAAAVMVIISAVAALRGRDTMVIQGPVHTYVNGVQIQWDEVRLSHKGDETFLHEGRVKHELEMYPLIAVERQNSGVESEWNVPVEDAERIILQRSGSWNQTKRDEIYRVDYYTEITRDGIDVVLNRRGRQIENPSGFIYDNQDTYIFLEPLMLSWNGKQENLEPLTVVQVSYMDAIQIFGPGLEPVYEKLDGEEVTAEFAGGKKVNLATDRYYTGNGAWRLLFLPLDVLPGVE